VSSTAQTGALLYAGMVELPFLVYGKTHILLGEWGFIKAHFSLPELEREFHGYLHAKSPDDVYLGVWGARTCSRFRRLLRERGVVFSVVALPSELKIIAQRATNPKAHHKVMPNG
jgi:hypothetical protein